MEENRKDNGRRWAYDLRSDEIRAQIGIQLTLILSGWQKPQS